MTRTHTPVLAGELIELADPRPGETAVDCTVGGGGHARLIADRLGPAGTLIGVDRDPLAEERFAALAAEVQCETRFIRADFVTALHELWPHSRLAFPPVIDQVTVTPAAAVWLSTSSALTVNGWGTPMGTDPDGAVTIEIASSPRAS